MKINAKRLGDTGEKLVSEVLSCLPSNNFKLYNNVLIKTKAGTTQIDHILVSTRGIFVIETKAHKGKIFGDCNSKYWTQCLFGKNKIVNRYKFYSPYKQNIGHIKNLINILNTKCICGIVCFSNKDVDLSSVNCESVIHISFLYQVVCNVFSSSGYADYNFNEMCALIEKQNIQSGYQSNKHIKYVKSLSKG